MKFYVCLIAAFVITIISCGKKDTPTPNTPPPSAGGGTNNPPNNPNPNPPANNSYYFNFNLGGKDYSFNANFPQYILDDELEVGGYQVDPADPLGRFIGLSFKFDHNPSDQEVKALAGKRIYFDDTDIKPELYYLESYDIPPFYSKDTNDHNYYVEIDKVTYLKHEPKDDWGFMAGDIYVISGTCRAVMHDYTTTTLLTNGKFNMVISRPIP